MASTIKPSTPDVERSEGSVVPVQIHGKEVEKEVKGIPVNETTAGKSPKRESGVLNELVYNLFLICLIMIIMVLCIIPFCVFVAAGIVGGRIGERIIIYARNIEIADFIRYTIHLHLMS